MIISSFTTNTFTGDVGATEFVFTDISTGPNPVIKRLWDFGDGSTLYDLSAATHTYNYPGVYSVRLQVTDTYGANNTSTLSVTADYVVRDAIQIVQIPSTFSKPSIPTPQPFIISVSSAQFADTLYVQLYAANSRSIPHSFVPDKWSYLAPTWRFTDKDYNIVSILPVKANPVYSNSKIVGSTGIAEFYYIDDLGVDLVNGDCALLLTLTLQPSSFYNPTDSQKYVYPSFANSNVTYATIAWQVNNLAPDYLKVTGNYLDGVHNTKWVNKKIPVLVTAHSNINDTVQLSSGSSGILFSYPATNQRGLKSELILSLSGLPTSAYRVENTPLHFQTTDTNNLHTGGYVYANIIPLIPTDQTAVIATVTTSINLTSNSFSKPFGYSIPTFTWVSNPESNKLHRISVVPYTESCSSIKAANSNNNLVEGAVFTANVPLISSTSTSNYNLTGFSGVYGMAIDIREQDLIAADAESDTIYRYSCTGALLSTLRLRISNGSFVASNGSGITTSAGKKLSIGYQDDIALTPSYVSLDRNYNMWVTLFNAVSVLKFDKDFNYLLAAAPGNVYSLTEDGDWLFKPPVVETDRLNNIWVTYAQTLCSALFKYDQYGNMLHKTELPSEYIPVGLAVSPSNGVWVANTLSVTPTGGNLQYYKSDGTLVTTITGFTRPSYIALDRKSNVWFTHGFREVGYINSITYATSSWSLSSNGILDVFQPIPIPNPDAILYKSEDEELGGLTIDALNRLWVIDSQKNVVHMLTADSTTVATASARQIKLLPDSNIGYAPNIKTTNTTVLTSTYYKSAQATGDWSGNRWLQKYGSDDAPLVGVSAPFTVYDYEEQLRIKTVNENFNTADQYKSLALPEHLNSNNTLFDNFFAAVVGNSAPSSYEDMGEKVYERIANFTQQHADVDTCSIDQLLSHCEAIDVSYLKYTADLPAEIKRSLDIFSITKEKLRGTVDNIPIVSESVGQLLNTQTAIITAGKKLFLQSKFNSLYTLITIPTLSGVSVYPLSALDGTGFAQPVSVNYLFYNYSPKYPVTETEELPVYIENVIDWNNINTSLSYNVSSKNDWYGDDGIVEKTFNYLLTKNLFPDT